MARHRNSEDRSFGASVLRAAAGGVVALVVTFALTALLSYLGRDDGTGGPAMEFQPTEVAQEQTPAPASEAESEEPATEAAAPSPTQATPQETTESSLGTVTVQVLDAVGSGTQAEQAAEVLRDLGYRVVVVNSTPRRVDTTTILATTGAQDKAEALRDEDPRFAVIKKNTAFNESVDLHVLVGPDFTP